MEVIEAIYKRRSIREYTGAKVERTAIETLIDAAIHAPSAINIQPWAFVVIQDAALLERYSDRAKRVFLEQAVGQPRYRLFHDALTRMDFNIFYNAGTLIVICADPQGINAAEDCCMAGENLMLAACAMGLGTCPIGLARAFLNLPEVKKELEIPLEFTAVLPIIVGYPNAKADVIPRNPARILAWKK